MKSSAFLSTSGMFLCFGGRSPINLQIHIHLKLLLPFHLYIIRNGSRERGTLTVLSLYLIKVLIRVKWIEMVMRKKLQNKVPQGGAAALNSSKCADGVCAPNVPLNFSKKEVHALKAAEHHHATKNTMEGY